jgi:multiple sugar transport system substrate-binding protein
MVRKIATLLLVLLVATSTAVFANGQKGQQGGQQQDTQGGERQWAEAPDTWGDQVDMMTLKATVSQPLFRFADMWEEERGQGATVNITEVPIGNFHQKIFTDLVTGRGQYDAFLTASWYTGDYFAGDQYIYSLEQFRQSDEFDHPQWDPETVLPAMRDLYKWDGRWVGVPNDNDGQVMYYRKDILSNSQFQQQFQEEMGYELPNPPQTIEEYLDVAEFFDGKDWDNDGSSDHGVSMHLKVNAQGMFHFMSWAAPYVVSPENERFWFSAEDFEPLVNSPGHVAALEDLMELVQYGPEGMISWTLGESWDLFLKGDAVITFTWGDLGALAQDTEESSVKGKIGAAHMPGTMRAYDPIDGQWVEFDEPNKVGNTTGGSWHGVISTLSDAPHATYDYLAYMATEENAFWNFTRGWTGVDPGRTFAFLEPNGTASVEAYAEQGWNESDVQSYTNAFYNNFTNEHQLPYLMIPGANRYWRALDVQLNEAVSGQKSAEEALQTAYENFQKITERRGREQQLRLFKESLSIE